MSASPRTVSALPATGLPAPTEAERRVAEANARAAGLLVAALVEGGVRAAVVSPGSRNTPLMLGFAAHGSVDVAVVLDERVAGFYALGLARASGRPVALACTSGSAGAHYLPALIEAERSRVPLVVLTADRPPALHGCGAPQTIDQSRLFGDHVKLARTLPPPDGSAPRALRSAIGDAVARARACPAGPVHLNVQFREPLWAPGINAVAEPPYRAGVEHLPAERNPSAAAVAAVISAIVAARRGAIVCGPDAAPDPETGRAIAALGQALGWPVFAEAASGVRFASGATTVSAYDAVLRGPLAEVGPDCVLRFGGAVTSKPLSRWLAAFGLDRTILVDPAGARRDPEHLADRVVEADPRLLAEAVIGALGDAGEVVRRGVNWTARLLAADRLAAAQLDAACAEGWWSGAIVRRLIAALPSDGALHAANSMAIRDLDGFATADRGPWIFSSRGANGIDGTIATALGESRARATAPLALLIGDLATLHDVGGLLLAGQLAAEWPAPMAIVVVDNGGGGIFEYLAIAEHPGQFERMFLTPQPARLDRLCAAAGLDYVPVADGPALSAGLAEALCRPGITVLHAAIDRGDDVARHRAAWAAIGELTGEELG